MLWQGIQVNNEIDLQKQVYVMGSILSYFCGLNYLDPAGRKDIGKNFLQTGKYLEDMLKKFGEEKQDRTNVKAYQKVKALVEELKLKGQQVNQYPKNRRAEIGEHYLVEILKQIDNLTTEYRSQDNVRSLNELIERKIKRH